MKFFTPMGLILAISLTGHAQAVPRIFDLPKEIEPLKQRAQRIATRLAEAVKTQEPKWKLEDGGFEGAAGFFPEGPNRLEYVKQQNWRAGKYRVEVRVKVFESAEDASAKLKRESHGSSISGPSPLEGVGDEAYIVRQRYFSWIGARRGVAVVWVYGPVEALSRGFVNLALPLMVEKE